MVVINIDIWKKVLFKVWRVNLCVVGIINVISKRRGKNKCLLFVI